MTTSVTTQRLSNNLANRDHRFRFTRLFQRAAWSKLKLLLGEFPAVALLGPRQIGKTTLARAWEESSGGHYLDLENPADRAKLADPEDYLARHEGHLVILDEIHLVPELFAVLRGLIDRGRRRGMKAGRFLLLGSASLDLLRQSSETLAGRLATLELSGLTVAETGPDLLERLWLRGGFPDSVTAASDGASSRWRAAFIRSYLERDIPQLGPRIPAETLRRFWTMLAHEQGSLLNAADLARSLSVSGKTIASYLDLFVDLLLVRRLEPWHANVSKRLVKSPRIYLRDTGLLHELLGIRNIEELLAHPKLGASWEGFVIENLLASLPVDGRATFFRSAAGAEIDLVLELPGRPAPWAIEIKRGPNPRPERGFHHACEDVQPERRYVVCSTSEPFSLGGGVKATGLTCLMNELASL